MSFHKDKYWRFISSFIDNPSTFGRINKWCSDEEKRWREFYAWKKIWITDISGISSPGTTSAEVCVYHRIEEYVERTENFDSMIGKLEKELGAREGKFEPKYGFAAEYYSTRKGS